MQDLFANYLVNAAWQAPVVALCAWLVSRFGGFSPAGRHRVWLLFLVTAAILPALSLSALLPHALPTVARVPAEATAIAAFDATAPDTAVLAPAAKPVFELAAWSAWAISALSAAVVLMLLVRLTLAAAAARRLVRQSRPVALPASIALDLTRLAQTHNRAAAPVRRSFQVSGPAVVGALSPVILIPEGLAVDDQDLRAALLHEMAHVIRHDYAINVACELLTLPVCWHPALMGLKAGVARSRERACDAMAAEAMGSPKAYARRLVSLAQTFGAPRQASGSASPSNPALAVGLFGRSDLEDRLMHLMKPKDTEPGALRAARLCGLAAIGAGLLGSAALLHVTPVFAQAPTVSGTHPAVSPATIAAGEAHSDAAEREAEKAEPATASARRHGRVSVSRHGVIINAEDGGYHHTFTSADGREFDVTTSDAKDLTPEQKRHWEDTVAKAEAKADAVMQRVNSPEFKARIAAAQKAGAEAEARVNSPEFKARIAAAQAHAADVQNMVNSPEFRAKIAAAQTSAAEAEAMVDSAEFKARIAAVAKINAKVNADVQVRVAAVQKMVNSPEFKAKIARAAEASARVNSPEFKERMERIERMERREAPDRDEAPSPAPSPAP